MTKPAYLLTGESFLVDEALSKLRAEVGGDALSEVGFDASSQASDIVGALDTPSLLGGARLVVVREAQSLKKDQIEALENYLASPAPGSVLVLIADGATKLQGAVRKVGAIVNVEVPKGRRLVAWIRERAGAHRIKLDERAAWVLIDAVGSELRDLDGALQQLATGVERDARVGATEVRRAFPRLADERIFALTDAVGERRLPGAMATLRRLLDQGDEPLVLFGALTAHIRRLLIGRSFVEGGPRALAEALGIPEWRARKLHGQVRSYRDEELVAAMEVLARTDLEMKGGDLSAEVALERAVIEIVTSARDVEALGQA